jgi:hypothetical protein
MCAKIQCAHCKENQPAFRGFSNHSAANPATAIAQTTVAPLGKSSHGTATGRRQCGELWTLHGAQSDQ